MRIAYLIVGLATSALGACTLLVSTSGLATDVIDASVPPEASVSEGGVDGGADAATADAAAEDPCAGEVVLCERFDTPAAVSGYPSDTDSTTRITADAELHVSPPLSAMFVIDPSLENTSPDATITLRTTMALPRIVATAKVRIERAEPEQFARLFMVTTGGAGVLHFSPSGGINGTVTPPRLAAVALGRWVPVRIELLLDETPPTGNITVDDSSTGPFGLGDGWTVGPLVLRLGISEANSPTTGWIVRWDDVVVRKL